MPSLLRSQLAIERSIGDLSGLMEYPDEESQGQALALILLLSIFLLRNEGKMGTYLISVDGKEKVIFLIPINHNRLIYSSNDVYLSKEEYLPYKLQID